MKSNYAIIGLQWGDEGKGKIVDIFSEKVKVNIRYQGGHNAGHTVVVGDKKIVLHLIPSGIIYDDTICLIGNGVVLDPFAFLDEIKQLKKIGINVKDRLFISKNTHLILPYHSMFDTLLEDLKGKDKIGTTKRGIGPAYEDKYGRRGLKTAHLLDKKELKKQLSYNVKLKNIYLKGLGEKLLDFDETYKKMLSIVDGMKGYIIDMFAKLEELRHKNYPMLFEGAQGSLLDIDYGTYPYVSSSNPTTGGILTGAMAGSDLPLKIMGVAKAYSTRVGKGPFPTENKSSCGKILRDKGGEYGATTGRPRRCGWLDLFSLKYTTKINGVDKIILTKIDVLDEFETIKVCTGYKYKGQRLNSFPTESWILDKVNPEWVKLSGWKNSTYSLNEYSKLPENAKKYIKFIEDYLDIPISMISTGPERSQIIVREKIV